MLQNVVLRGTARAAKSLGRPVAGKTGTTNDFIDAWFVGYSPGLVAGVWVGIDDQESLGSKEAGGRAALPIWMEFMQQALERVPLQEFVAPPHVRLVRVHPRTGSSGEVGAGEGIQIALADDPGVDGTRPRQALRTGQPGMSTVSAPPRWRDLGLRGYDTSSAPSEVSPQEEPPASVD
jgi:penicillin-binding protein 1A